MKTHAKSHTSGKAESQNKKQGRDSSSPKSNVVDTGEHISTNSSKENPNKPKRLGDSQTEINDDTTI